jgi:DNA (cytosine-5)-methyltransferase 1
LVIEGTDEESGVIRVEGPYRESVEGCGGERVTHLSLFSGIGGIDLAAHWAGFETVAFVEKDPFCQKVLAKNFPGVPIYDDVTIFDPTPYKGVDLVSGGFPCQDVSQAGKREGIEGSRSGLYRELLRTIRVVRPRYVLVENTAGLLARGMGVVLSGLASCGFDAEWSMLSACALGAPHTRQRMFIVAYPNGQHGEEGLGPITNRTPPDERGDDTKMFRGWHVPYTGVRGVAKRVSPELDKSRVMALGNSVNPPQVYPILQAIADQLKEAA